jgi:signal transduction histidine kinase/ActR/RegA family two-component response regulator
MLDQFLSALDGHVLLFTAFTFAAFSLPLSLLVSSLLKRGRENAGVSSCWRCRCVGRITSAISSAASLEGVALVLAEEGRAMFGSRVAATIIKASDPGGSESVRGAAISGQRFLGSEWWKEIRNSSYLRSSFERHLPVRTRIEVEDGKAACVLERGALSADGWNSLLACPFVTRENKNCGLIIVLDRRPGGFTAHDETRLAEIASLASLVIEARLSDLSLRERFGELEQLRAALEKRVEERTAELQKAKDEAESASRLKTNFLAIMSHEIRTPLNTVLGYAEILRDRHIKDDETRETLTIIERSARHLGDLMGDVLDLSRIESGDVQIERTTCSPLIVMGSVVSALAVRAKAKRVDLIDFCETPIPDKIISDPTRIQQVLFNLVGNALKFTEIGSVVVTARYDPHSTGLARLEFRVRDSGIGIPPDRLEDIFEPFTQVDTSTSRRYEGSGLGLSISRRLARLLDGDIAVESKPGVGSVFCFGFDCRTPPDVSFVRRNPSFVARERHEEESIGFARIDARVLVVDDFALGREIVRKRLTAYGATVEEAGSGEDAIRKCLDAEFDLILLDVRLPTMDGFQTLAELRRIGVETPAIALTAHALSEDRDRCLDSGFAAFVPKPVNWDRLSRLLAALVKTRV